MTAIFHYEGGLIPVPVSRQKSDIHICALALSILSLIDISIGFWKYHDCVILLGFHFIGIVIDLDQSNILFFSFSLNIYCSSKAEIDLAQSYHNV